MEQKKMHLVFRQPETPKEPMEFLSRSWSVSAMEVAKALCPAATHSHHSNTYCPLLPAKTTTTISELDDVVVGNNNNFSFGGHLVLDRIMSTHFSAQAQAADDMSPTSSGRLSNGSGSCPFLNDTLSDTPPHSPPFDLKDTTSPFTQSNQCRISTASSSSVGVVGGKTLGRWFKDRREKKREETRAQNAQVHAAVSVAGVAAAVAAIATATATAASQGSRKDEQGTKTDLAVASAAALVAAQCVEAAENMGAEPEHLSSVVKSSVNVQSPGDIMTLTAAAATGSIQTFRNQLHCIYIYTYRTGFVALRGAATLRARTTKDVWSIGSVVINPTVDNKVMLLFKKTTIS